MSSKVDKVKALEMRQGGATLREIGAEFGVTRERIRQIIGSGGGPAPGPCLGCGAALPDGCHSRRRYCSRKCYMENAPAAQRKYGKCPKCAGRMAPAAALCRPCRVKAYHEHGDNRLVVELWRRGESISTIAAALDTTVNTLGVRIHRMRKYGFDLPYRRRVFINGTPAFPDQEIREMRPEPVSVLDLNTKEILARARRADKRRASGVFHAAVDRGEMTRPSTCDRCGADARIEAHHADYAKPLEVEWLCFPCHRALHIEAGTYKSKAAA